jgi:hypothetical protein
MIPVTIGRLVAILRQHPGAAIITAVTRTQPRLLAKSRADGTPTADRYPHGIEKLALARLMVATRYATNVRAQRRRERHPAPDAFTASPLWAGHGHRLNEYLVAHVDGDRLYLRARPQTDAAGNHVKLWERWIDLARGVDLTPDELEILRRDYLRDRPAANRKQQLHRAVPYQTYHLVSVLSVTVAGKVYALAPDRSAFLPP